MFTTSVTYQMHSIFVRETSTAIFRYYTAHYLIAEFVVVNFCCDSIAKRLYSKPVPLEVPEKPRICRTLAIIPPASSSFFSFLQFLCINFSRSCRLAHNLPHFMYRLPQHYKVRSGKNPSSRRLNLLQRQMYDEYDISLSSPLTQDCMNLQYSCPC